MRWGDSSASGRTVTLKLPDDGDEHPFKGLDVGSKNGQMLEIEVALVENGELKTLSAPGKPKPHVKARIPAKPRTKSISPTRRATLENVTKTIIKTVEVPAAPVASPPPSPVIPAPQTVATPSPPAPPVSAPTPPPMHSEPIDEYPDANPVAQQNAGSNDIDGANLDAYADQMGQAAEALAAVAERLDMEDKGQDDQPHYPRPPMFDDDEAEEPGIAVVRRAFDLCKAIDKQRAGFFYFMRSRYPEAPKLPGEGGEWSRDAKSTRDRVCLHCETSTLTGLAEDIEARKRFEELENEFERHERLR